MRKKLLAVGFVLAAITLSGCANSLWTGHVEGTKISEEQSSKFIKGKTTEKEVRTVLGEPQDIKFEGNKKILVYQYQKTTINPFSSTDESETKFIFNDKGILADTLKTSASLPGLFKR